MTKVFHSAVTPLGRPDQGWVGLALLFANLIRTQLTHN